MKPIKILRLNRKHLSQMTYYFTSFQDNSCSHDGQSSICYIYNTKYIEIISRRASTWLKHAHLSETETYH